MHGKIRAGHALTSTQQNSRTIERYVAIPDDNGGLRIKRRIEVPEIWMSIVPTNKSCRPEDAILISARNGKLAISLHAGRKHHRIIEITQFGQTNMPVDLHVAIVIDLFNKCRLFKFLGNAFGRLMVGRNAAPNQSVGRRQALDNINFTGLASAKQGLGSIKPGRSRSDDGDPDGHSPTPPAPLP